MNWRVLARLALITFAFARSGYVEAAEPEPDTSVRKAIEQPGVAIVANEEGRIVEVAVGMPTDDALLKMLASLPELRKLHVETSRSLTLAGIESLTAAPALEALSLYDLALPKECFEPLTRIAKLKELSIQECGLVDGDLKPLESISGLRSLSLRGNAITDAGLESIVGLVSLDELDLANSSSAASAMSISDEGLRRLTALKRLRRLDLSSTRAPQAFTDQGLSHLSAFPDLESLELAGFSLTDESLAHIGRCTKLRSLGLHFGGFTDAGMKELRQLKELRRISISSGSITEAGLLHLGALSRLEFVELRTNAVTDRVLERLSMLMSLARLDLYANSLPGVSQSAPRFTPQGLAYFKEHPSLRTLWLTNTDIDGELLAALKEMTQLGELTLMMPGLSDDEVRGLQAALPSTRVSAAWGGHGIAPLQAIESSR